MIGFIYFIIIILANIIGAISGMGGGVIIKPLFDYFNFHDPLTIALYSSIAVFSMSLISIYKQSQSTHQFQWSLVCFLSLGSISGGIIGDKLLTTLSQWLNNNNLVQIIQIILTIIILLSTYLYSKLTINNYCFHNKIIYTLAGLLLGAIASFLGIGGGPINVSLLMFLFSLSIKTATTYSIGTIFFSQLAKINTNIIVGLPPQFDTSLLIYVISAGLVGGFIGSILKQYASDKIIQLVFEYVIILVIMINLYNLINI